MITDHIHEYTKMTDEEKVYLKKNRRGKICCCDKEIFLFRFTLFCILVDIILLGVLSSSYIKEIFSDHALSSLEVFYTDEVKYLSQESKDRASRNFLLVLLTSYFMLWAKVVSAIGFIFKKYSKKAFNVYYLCSWSFYGSFIA